MASVSLSDSLETVGDCSFYMCGLESLYVPSNVSELGVCSVGYTPTESGASQVEGFTVLGRKKSAAADYAKENSLSFRNADDSAHAFAIQRINGQRVAIPSIFLFAGGFLILAAAFLILLRNMKFRKK